VADHGQGLAGFGERLLAVIDEGRRTATYKLALLLALIDVCAENPTPSGAAPQRVGTRTIARRVAELYWPQVRPYPSGEGVLVLRQITNKQATILHAVASLAAKVGSSVPFARAESMDPGGFEVMLDEVELTVARYPLLRLQTVDGIPQPFIYDVDWTEGVTLRRLRQEGWVRFRPGAGDQLVRLAPSSVPWSSSTGSAWWRP
jgi:hypothetical protein